MSFVDPSGLAKGGKQNLRDTGLSELTDAEIDDMARRKQIVGARNESKKCKNAETRGNAVVKETSKYVYLD